MANPNFSTASAIRGHLSLQHVTTTPTSIAENAAASDTALKVNALIVTNVATTDAAVTADIVRAGVATHVIRNLLVPPNNSVVLMAKENPFYLNEGDTLRLAASVNGAIEAVCSYEEFVQ